MPDLSTYSPDTIKLTAGVSGAILSNITGIPPDKFRVLVAQDLNSAQPLGRHFRNTFGTLGDAFVGATARVSMKTMATGMNLYVPPEWRESNPFGCAFAVGFCFSPILNIPRIFQLQKIGGHRYPATLGNFFGSFAGLVKYGQNTAMFAPGEGLRMMTCFGTKDFLMPRIGGKRDPREINIPMFSAQMALIAGPMVSMVETTFALVTETITTIHAKTSTVAEGAAKRSFGEVLKETITPKYTYRCFVSLCFKNFFANTPLFWIMFMADFYSKKHRLNKGEITM